MNKFELLILDSAQLVYNPNSMMIAIYHQVKSLIDL